MPWEQTVFLKQIIPFMKSLKETIYSVYFPFTRIVHEIWAVASPTSYAKYGYRKATHKKLNLDSPKDYNEKVQWLKIYSDTTQWTELADKYKVRKYIEQCNLSDILVKSYGVWKKAEEIDFSVLPEKFVLKTNNSSGKVLLVYDKSKLNIEQTRILLNKWVNEKRGLISFEPHYWNIDRRIIAEEFLEDNLHNRLSSSLIDYKFFCFHGEPNIVNVLFDRNNLIVGSPEKKSKLNYRENIFDLDWNLRTDMFANPTGLDMSLIIPKPNCFDEMIKICRILSKPFPQVRVDLYEVNNKVYFGEMTFTSGSMNDFSSDCLFKMGELIDLSAAKLRKKRFII
jgi:hypothetical protein